MQGLQGLGVLGDDRKGPALVLVCFGEGQQSRGCEDVKSRVRRSSGTNDALFPELPRAATM